MSSMLIQDESLLQFSTLMKRYLGGSTICDMSNFPTNIAKILNTDPHEYYRMYIEGDFENFYIPNKIIHIASYAFYNCDNLALTSLPDTVTTIGSYAFYNCDNLALTSLPDTVTTIGSYAFYNCDNLALTSLPLNLVSIGYDAFGSCPSITELTFRGTPTTIDNGAFYHCNNLTTINVPWAEDEVAGAPWGATNAIINYNYVNADA